MRRLSTSCLSRRAVLTGSLALGVTAPLLAACGNPPPPATTFADMRWTHQPPIMLAAMGPEVIDHFHAPRQDPHVEYLMPVSPDQAIRTWVQDRLQSTGVGTRTVRVVIEDASVVEVPLKTKKGVSGFFTDEPDVRYDAKASVVVQLVDANGAVEVQTRQEAWRSKSLSEKASLADRQKAWYDLVEEMMKDLDGALEKGIRGYFGTAVMS